MLRVYVYGKYKQGFLQLPAGTRLQMDLIFPNFDENLTLGDYSLPLDFELTDLNREILNMDEMLLQQLNKQQYYWRVDVYDEFDPILLDAKLTLLKDGGTFTGSSGKCSVSISGTMGLFGTAIKNKKLNELAMGGKISWQGKDSRHFATDVMKGTENYPYLLFAPVVHEEFFNEEDSGYTNETIFNQTANNVFVTNGSWVFGKKSDASVLPAAPGDADYVAHRTIPFFRLVYVVQQIFAEHGFTVGGDFFTNGWFNDVALYNNFAIEKYHQTINTDTNKEITPYNHLPDVLVADFLREFQKAFSLRFVFTGGQKVFIGFKRLKTQERKRLNISPIVVNAFEGSYLQYADTGFAVKFEFDGNDDLAQERVQPLKDKTLVCTITTKAALDGFRLSRPFTTDDVALVLAENMYYQVTVGGLVPQWDAYIERLDGQTIGNGETEISSSLAPLVTHVAENTTTGLIENKDVCAVRIKGGYINSAGLVLRKPFGLRMFYCKMMLVNGVSQPRSFVHNRNKDNSIRVPLSLSLQAEDSLWQLHQYWVAMLQQTKEVTTQLLIDDYWWQQLKNADVWQHGHVNYVPKNVLIDYPVGDRQLVQVTMYRDL